MLHTPTHTHAMLHAIHSYTNGAAHYIVAQLEDMPFAHGIVVWIMAGISSGYVIYSDLPLAALVMQWTTYVVVVVFGLSALWLLLTDRRRGNRALSLTVVLVVTMMAARYPGVDSLLFNMLHDISVMVVIGLFFFVGLHGYVARTSRGR